MNNSRVNGIIILAVFGGLIFYIGKNYLNKKRRERELRESLHFQLF